MEQHECTTSGATERTPISPRDAKKTVTAALIWQILCAYLDVDTDRAAQRPERLDEGVFPRKMYAYLARYYTRASMEAVGEVCGCSKKWVKAVSDELRKRIETTNDLDDVVNELLCRINEQCPKPEKKKKAPRARPPKRAVVTGRACVKRSSSGGSKKKKRVFSHLLEPEDHALDMEERLKRASARVRRIGEGSIEGSAYVLREKQIDVYVACADFIDEVVFNPGSFQDGIPTGRIVLPPRTGKTVIGGQIIIGTGLITTFIVPTEDLVEQAAADLRKQLPDVPIGVYYGKRKELVEFGINVTTYQILQLRFSTVGELPREIRMSSLVLADEGHHSMSEDRQRFLREGFHPLAIRIALTATPDYNRRKRLAFYFEHLICEITVSEAMELDMFAPLRVWIAEVDVDASSVEIVSGDYDEDQLGRVTGTAPFFAATCAYRYAEINRDKQALITCASRQQAYDLLEYMRRKRPPGTMEPVVVVGETSGRNEINAKFNRGEIDTLIVVRIFIEGWNSPRCKLLIDLGLSLSWVLSMQKFFRPMTKWGEEEAHIYMLIPTGLPEMPITPLDLFEWNRPDYEQGEMIASTRRRQRDRGKQPPEIKGAVGIEKVRFRASIRFHARFEKPKLDPKDDKQILEVLLSRSEMHGGSLPLYFAFSRLVFDHELFRGLGKNLLRFCGISQDRFAYVIFMYRFFPEAASDLYVGNRNYNKLGPENKGLQLEVDRRTCVDDRAHIQTALVAEGAHKGFAFGWKAVCGRTEFEIADRPPQELCVRRRQLAEVIRVVIATLTPREERVIRMRFGIGEKEDHTLEEVAQDFFVGRERIRQIEAKALRKLRHPSRCKKLKQFIDG